MNAKILRTILGMTLIGFTISGCIIINGKSVQGSGNIITATREVSEFHKIHLKGSGKVFLTPGEKQALEIKTDDNIMPLIETDVSADKLTISDGNNHLSPTKLEVYITVENLEGVAISGSGNISSRDRFVADAFYAEIRGSRELELEVETGKLTSEISGSGSIRLSGKALVYTASISGTGKINAFGVEAENVSIKISGSGDCSIYASESLDAKISGSGDVYYKGRPRIHSKISGSGSLTSMD